jgi:hypothetical protein
VFAEAACPARRPFLDRAAEESAGEVKKYGKISEESAGQVESTINFAEKKAKFRLHAAVIHNMTH